MKFDTIHDAPCLAGETDPCVVGTASADCSDPTYRAAHPECEDPAECSDPEYAAAHPELCLKSARLIIKPDTAIVSIRQSVTFEAFLWSGGRESAIGSGVKFTVSNMALAMIGIASGSLTGIAEGIVTVTAQYGSLMAFAQVTVLNDCSVVPNNFALLIDKSKSSTQQMTGGTKLAVAKKLAKDLIECMATKDTVCVFSFDTTAYREQDTTTSASEAVSAVNHISSGVGGTNVSSALAAAQSYFGVHAVRDDSRVYVLFTDGVNHEGENIIAQARNLRDAGSVVIVVGLRSEGHWFNQLESVASGGFFINVTSQNATDAVDWLQGVKGLLCSGDCSPTGDRIVARPTLNFESFTKWDNLDGHVDLIGAGEDGFKLYDLLPGHGMYVDLAGSSGSSLSIGSIRTKDDITLTPGNNYRIRFKLAGNNREEREDDVVRVAMKNGATVIATEDYSVPFDQDFTEETIDFIAAEAQGKLEFQQLSIGSNSWDYGCMLDDVVVQDLTAGTVVFEDNFDHENRIYVGPKCGASQVIDTSDPNSPQVDCTNRTCVFDGVYVRVYGSDCSGACGCLQAAIPAQVPDTDVLPDVEDPNVIVPVTYVSTRSYVATCPAGSVGDSVTRSAVASSMVSQEDADALALAAAAVLAEGDIKCVYEITNNTLINFNFQPLDADSADIKTGFAVFGIEHQDVWNTPLSLQSYTFDASGFRIGATLNTQYGVASLSLIDDYTSHFDPLFRQANKIVFGAQPSVTYRIGGLPDGTYSVVVYGHDLVATLTLPDTIADGDGWKVNGYLDGVNYIRFNSVTPLPDGSGNFYIDVVISANVGDAYLSGLQLLRTA